jgi:ABC-type transporter Mla subunit MlaD
VPITDLGSQSLAGIIPGMGSAISSLQAASAALSAMKADKDSDLNQLTARVSAINDVLGEAGALIAGAQDLLNQANAVLNSSDELLGNLAGALAAAGIHLYGYAGAAGDLGSDLGTALGEGGAYGADQEVFGLVLICADGGSWAAVSTILKTS